jgi:hypothetical protein
MAGMRPGQAKGPSVQRPSGGGGGGAPATATFATIANEAATLPNSRRLLAGTNVSFVDGGAGGTFQINASGGPIASPYAKELWPFATNEMESAIAQNGTGIGANNGTRAFGFISEGTVTISQMVVWFSQITGSNVRLGLYDSLSNRIAQTNRFSPAVGINVVPLIAPVVLTGAMLYYMGYWMDDTTGNNRFLVLSGRSTTTTSPNMQKSDPNEMPASIGTSFTNTAFRPWLMVSG